jgi:2-dehydro-3-deoxygluconokinase
MSPPGVVAVGELMLRLSAPGRELFLQSPRFETCFGGAEVNVAVALSRLGTPARFVSTLPVGPLGDAAMTMLRGDGVDVSYVARAEGRLGLYFVAPGAGIRASEVIYDRAGSAFASHGTSEVDWDAALAGAAWLHVSGVTLAVSEAAEKTACKAIASARANGVKVSFDCNFRARLWQARGIDPRGTIARLIDQTDLVFADYRDVRLLTGDDVSSADPDATRRETAARLFALFPGLRYVAGVDRRVESHDCHTLVAGVVARNGIVALTQPIRLTAIVDRIGGGDAFAAGLLHAIDRAPTLQSAIDFAAMTGALKHTVPGDMLRLDEQSIARVIAGADIQR